MTSDDGASDSPYQRAADLAVHGHPLPGEDLSTPHLDDAEHWIRVYSELLDFKTALLDSVQERVHEMPPEAVEEVERTDALVLQAEADRFRKRLAMWRARREELSR